MKPVYKELACTLKAHIYIHNYACMYNDMNFTSKGWWTFHKMGHMRHVIVLHFGTGTYNSLIRYTYMHVHGY